MMEEKIINEKDRVELYHEFMHKLGKYENKELDEYLNKYGFFTQAASTRFHGAYSGGLFDHSLNVGAVLVDLTQKLNLKWQKERSPYLVGMLHDICKIDNYILLPDNTFAYNRLSQNGHGDKSVSILLNLIPDLTDEEMLCIRWHMGSFDDKVNWQHYTDSIKKYPNVLYTHFADMISAHIIEKEN